MLTQEVSIDLIKDAEVTKGTIAVGVAIVRDSLMKLCIMTNKRKRSGDYKEKNNYYLKKISQDDNSTVVHLHREEEDILPDEHEFYQVVIHKNPAKTRCDCKGFTFKQGILCKHIVAVQAIM